MAKKEVKKVSSIRLSPKMMSFLRKKAQETGKTVSFLIRSLIKKEQR